MKKFLLLFFSLSTLIIHATEKEIVALVVFENLTDKEFTSGKFFITQVDKVLEVLDVNSESGFEIVLPEKGKYKFSFYSPDFTTYTYYAARISSKNEIITIRLEEKNGDDFNTMPSPLSFNSLNLNYFNNDQIEKMVEEEKINFVIHGISKSVIDFSEFKEKYGIAFFTENCTIDPLTFMRAIEHNKRIEEFLNEKYGSEWKNYLPTKPFGLK